MKTISYTCIVAVICIAIFANYSCQKQESQTAEIAPAELKQIAADGQKAAGRLMKSLKKELFSAIDKKGVAGAIGICKDRALDITDSMARTSSNIVDIRRTTNKYRNPLNKPDELDTQVLSEYEKLFLSGDDVPEFIIRPVSVNGASYHRYYQPLKAQPLCLSCHGPKSKMDPEVVSLLSDKYPGDMAHGYQAYQFRGLIRVTLASGNSNSH